ncbi:MAG: ABC transporter substrate-binding protein [Bifidobacteriaceae bacterium]|nr:ABC transporter substrate-binding protein [Bifidobacteriaceae bacterium]
MTTSLAACGDGADPGGSKTEGGDGPVSLSLWTVFTGSDGDILREIVDKYNDSNDKGITINLDIMPNDQLQQKLPAAISTGTAPDFVLFGVEFLPTYVASGSLEDISDFWDKTGVDPDNYLERVVQLAQVDGKQYGTPMQYNLQYLYWNKDLFEAAGLDPDKPPATLDELADYAVKLTDPDKNQFGLALPVDASAYPQFFWANGGDIDDPATNTNLLDSPENLATLEWAADLAVNKKVTPQAVTGSEADTMLQNGQLAMLMSGPWQINGLRSQGVDFGVGPIPGGSAGAFSPEGGCAYMIPKGADSAKRDATYDFMAYWLSDEIMKEWSVRNGFPVFSKSAAELPEVTGDEVLKSISAATTIGRDYNLGYPLAAQIDKDAIWPLWEAVLTGSTQPAEALKSASEALDSILAQG